MLKKSHITNIEIYSDDWHIHRLGRFTSSRMVALIGEKAFNSYLYQKVGEIMTGKSNDKEFEFNEDLDWGKLYEDEAIQLFGQKMGIQFLVTQKLISDPDSKFASTPDAIWVHGESKIVENEYNVSTAECKCPRTYHNFIAYCMCKTPADLKSKKADYYWQTIDQMHQTDAAVGYFFVYHPYFPPGSNLHIIKFRKMELWEDFRYLSERKRLAVVAFEEIRSQMLALSS